MYINLYAVCVQKNLGNLSEISPTLDQRIFLTFLNKNKIKLIMVEIKSYYTMWKLDTKIEV